MSLILEGSDVVQRGAGRELVVIVHGSLGGQAPLAQLRATVEAELPDADILAPTYRGGAFSNTDLFELAAALDDLIEQSVTERTQRPDRHEYERVLLVGFSLGALLVRKAYVYAVGQRQDYPVAGFREARTWARKVARVLLMAGMNRGWSLAERPAEMGRADFALRRFALLVARLTGTGRMMRGAQRGAPFVANLRVQWAQLPEGCRPPTVQLLGTIDDTVHEDDNSDLFVSLDFTFIPVVQTGHAEIVRFDDPPFGKRRRQIFVDALTAPEATLREKYRPDHDRAVARQDRKPESHVVFIMHGIRDTGYWTQQLADEFRQRDPGVGVRTAKYRYFPMAAFLVLGARQRYVRWFMDLYTEEIAKSPHAQVSYVGHSNGTYIVAKALEKYATLRLHRVVFAGSVVPRSFEWTRWIEGERRVGAVRNFVAAGDWVVAIFPRFFELMMELTGLRALGDIGSAGFNGFEDRHGNEFEQRVRGSHGGALVAANFGPIAEFVLRGRAELPEQVKELRPAPLVGLGSRLCWLIWLGLAAAIVGVGVWSTAWVAGATSLPLAVCWVAYAAFVWLLLQTV